ncbi:DUF397 domain-containing protein [Streptomyces sp. CBMA156]|uniref:DUF397 domain-containing protein n=1 Tax=Streptomyces sp. CBMA156 TaxID=1930280 RepID=UPI0016618FD2|nr:DUF397 domain-containing protein [Streptomyces sp. CBMA156]MBD0671230.1 hypothetical protein [Streptomyces sp. CBMA156]
MDELAWKRPTACGDGNNCPEVAVTSDAVYVRSSLLPDAVAQLTPDEWRNLVTAIRQNEFGL